MNSVGPGRTGTPHLRSLLAGTLPRLGQRRLRLDHHRSDVAAWRSIGYERDRACHILGAQGVVMTGVAPQSPIPNDGFQRVLRHG